MNSEVAAYICSHVFDDIRPVLFVSRADGDWQCLCGADHGAGELPRVVGLNHLYERDPTLTALRNLPKNWEAERVSINDPWILKRIL